ncbi:MAG: sporulation protein [Halieaceae bacterium]|jgi:cell division protein FtsN|nr:MAG: sporulation protein [Halieaceae bacterium]
MSSQASATVESSPQPSFTFFSTLEDESFQIDSSSTADARTSMYTQYVLQAGSFRATEDADKRRGELALLGLESKIEEMKTDTGIWHRVYIGPFQSRSKMAKARSLTAQSDIDTLLLKRAQ